MWCFLEVVDASVVQMIKYEAIELQNQDALVDVSKIQMLTR